MPLYIKYYTNRFLHQPNLLWWFKRFSLIIFYLTLASLPNLMLATFLNCKCDRMDFTLEKIL